MVSIIFSVDCEHGVDCFETLYDSRANATLTSATFGQTTLVINAEIGTCSKYLPLYIAAVNIVASIVCYRWVFDQLLYKLTQGKVLHFKKNDLSKFILLMSITAFCLSSTVSLQSKISEFYRVLF